MKTYKPTSAGRRGMSVTSYKKTLTRSMPHKALTKGIKRSMGRNNAGRLTSQHRGGGHKRKIREMDFLYDKQGISAVVESIEYDPNRSGFIALLCYKDGERRYVLAPQTLAVGDTVLTDEKASLKVGNRLPLAKIPVGTFVYNVELRAGSGARLARSAGNYVEIVAHEGGYVHLKMPSTEVRKVPEGAWASVGEVSNAEHRLVTIGKAGRSRWLGRRPLTRGSARNPVDHPYGGGEGRSGLGHRRRRTKQGRPTGHGQKTRKPKKYSNVHIVSRRKVGKKRG